MNNDDISHFSTIPASFAIKSNVYFITHQYLIINNSQSQRTLSVSVRTVLWIYSRRNCGLLPQTVTIMSMLLDSILRWVGLVVSMSGSHVVGRGFASQPGDQMGHNEKSDRKMISTMTKRNGLMQMCHNTESKYYQITEIK